MNTKAALLLQSPQSEVSGGYPQGAGESQHITLHVSDSASDPDFIFLQVQHAVIQGKSIENFIPFRRVDLMEQLITVRPA